MKVQFSEITNAGTRYTVTDQAWVARTEVAVIEKPRAELLFILVNDITATLEGSLKTGIVSACGRCGCSLEFAVDTIYNYIFRLESDKSHHEKELELSDEDSQTVFLEKPEISVDEILQEQLILAIPEKLLCSEECRGLCHNCGAMLNREKCTCVTDTSDSPFAVLKKLKTKPK